MIVPLDHFGTGFRSHGRGVVRTIVGNDEEPVAWKQLILNVCKGWQKSQAFVVCRHQNSKSPARGTIHFFGALPSRQRGRGNNLEQKNNDGCRKKDCDGYQYAGD
jgi:hypothetical protein